MIINLICNTYAIYKTIGCINDAIKVINYCRGLSIIKRYL